MNNPTKVLIVDDEERMRRLVHDLLEKNGYRVYEASDGIEALDIFAGNQDIDLIILDVMMPGKDGWETVKEIRQFSKVPVIMLTAKSNEKDELMGFELGVDEYISKPFSLKVLLARVEALLRRTKGDPGEQILEKGGIRLDKSAHRVMVGDNEVELSYKEFELLGFFMENEGIALSRDTILERVWNYDYYGDARTIDTHVKKLRSKLKESGDNIKTIWGIGYKFEVQSPLQ